MYRFCSACPNAAEERSHTIRFGLGAGVEPSFTACSSGVSVSPHRGVGMTEMDA